jgi:hypothetical protein
LLLVLPSVPQSLLLGTTQATPEATFFARIAGAALLAIGVACWLGRSATPGPAQLGLIAGVLVYDAVAVVLLAHAGLYSSLAGIALWPAVVLHAVLAVWCGVCLWR